MSVLGDPQHAYPVVHVAGTNGKTSVTRMVDALLRALHQRTGRNSSPHLQSVTERIALDGEPVTARTFVDTYRELQPYLELVDQRSEEAGGPRMSYFEVLTAMAFAAFADAPVEVAVVETGMGGTWDATNVVRPAVAVITPVGLDHTDYLGEDLATIAGEKAGIIQPGPEDDLLPRDPIAVIGMSCRYPGGADTPVAGPAQAPVSDSGGANAFGRIGFRVARQPGDMTVVDVLVQDALFLGDQHRHQHLAGHIGRGAHHVDDPVDGDDIADAFQRQARRG